MTPPISKRSIPTIIIIVVLVSAAALVIYQTALYKLELNNPIYSCISSDSKLPKFMERVAFIKPVFTMTPYYWQLHLQGRSFYEFYARHLTMKYNESIRLNSSDLALLNSKVTDKWSPTGYNLEYPLYEFLQTTARQCGLTVDTLTDVDVDNGSLFSSGIPNFDVIVLGHEEYLTAREYSQFKQFVSVGGRIVAVAGNTFWGQVNYSRSTNTETFVAGHGFAFNGTTAWRTNYAPFDKESANWFGSTFAGRGNGVVSNPTTIKVLGANETNGIGWNMSKIFGDSIFSTYNYGHNEINSIVNFTATQVIVRMEVTIYLDGNIYTSNSSLKVTVPVSSYVHQYRRGQVYCLGIYGENLLWNNDLSGEFFILEAITSGFKSEKT